MNEIKETIEALVTDNREKVTLTIDGVEYRVVTFEGFEKVSTLFSFELVCDDDALAVPPFELLGRMCVMTLYDGFDAMRTLTGLVAEAEREIKDDGGAEMRIVMRPAVYPLSLSRDSRVFNDMTVPQIVDRVMDKTKASHRWELTTSYRERVYTAQYREDDWVFISRLLEDEGIYYWFDHFGDGDTVVVFSDDSRGAPHIIGKPAIEFVFESGMIGDKELITELASEAHATPTKFTVGSFDPWNPMLKVMETRGDGIHEMYDAPGGGAEAPEVVAKQAQVRLECAMAHRAGVSGNSSSIRIEPGRRMEVFNHPAHDNSYFVTEVRYSARQRRRFQDAEEGGYECHFELIKAALPYRAPEDSPLAKQAGVQTGRVVGPGGEEIHTDFKGRVRVQLHWDREGGWDHKAGKWMRVAQRGVASSMLYPRIGWNVTTFMEEGSVDAPTVLSRLHDAEHPPTYKLPENKTRTVLRTLTSPGGGSANEIRFEDIAGAQEMFLNASKDMNYIVNDRMGYNVGNDHERKVAGNQDLDVGNAFMEDVQHDQTVKIGGDEEVEIEEGREKTVENDETEEITGNRKIECGSNMTTTVKLDRKLKVTGTTEETTEGQTNIMAENLNTTINGSTSHKSGGIIACTVGEKHVQTINASKFEAAKRDYSIEVNKNMTQNIGGSLVVLCGDTFTDGSDEKTNWTVKSAMRGFTPHVHLEAKDKITLQCGASTIVIDQQNITVTSPSYDLGSSAELLFVALRVTHNP